MNQDLIEIRAVATRTSVEPGKHCGGCPEEIEPNERYERVMWSDGSVTMHHAECFSAEFGERTRQDVQTKALRLSPAEAEEILASLGKAKGNRTLQSAMQKLKNHIGP